MKDCCGIELKRGDFISIKVGLETLVGDVADVKESNLALPGQPGQQALLPDSIFVTVRVDILNPGRGPIPHIRRIPHPEREVILPMSKKVAS